jgi:hypothetical protein
MRRCTGLSPSTKSGIALSFITYDAYSKKFLSKTFFINDTSPPLVTKQFFLVGRSATTAELKFAVVAAGFPLQFFQADNTPEAPMLEKIPLQSLAQNTTPPTAAGRVSPRSMLH